MGLRSNGVLLAVAGLLTAYALVFETGAPSLESRGRVFRDLAPSDVMKLEIRHPAAAADSAQIAASPTIVLRRRGEYEWWVESPVLSRGSLPRIQGLVWDLLEMVQVAQVPPESPAFAGAIPASGPLCAVFFQTQTGKEWVVEFGRDHPLVKGDVFARVDGKVIVTSRKLRDVFSVTVAELRSRAIVPVAAADAVLVRVEGLEAQRSMTIVRRDPGREWMFTAISRGEPPGAAVPDFAGTLADRKLVDELLGELNAWKIEEFEADDPKASDVYGLSSPRYRVEVHHRNGAKVLVDVASEAQGQDRGDVYVRHTGEAAVYRASAEPLPLLSRDAESFRTQYVFDFEGDEIVEVAAISAADSFTLRRSEAPGDEAADGGRRTARWSVVDAASGKTWPADALLTGGAVSELRQLLVEKFLPAAEEVPVSGPDARSLAIRLGPNRVVTLNFGVRTGADANFPLYPVRRSTDDSRLLVHSLWPERVDLGSWYFRDRAISGLESSELIELEVARGGERPWRMMRLPGEEWTLSADERMRAEGALAQALVGRLVLALHRDRFRVERFLSGIGSARFSECGVGESDYRFRVTLRAVSASLEGFRHLRIGYRDARGMTATSCYARADGLDVLFTLSGEVPEALERLVAHLAEVTERP